MDSVSPLRLPKHQSQGSYRDALVFQSKILDAISEKEPIGEILLSLVDFVETFEPGTVAAISLWDSTARVLRRGAARSLPERYLRAVDGLPVGPEVGSCGSAAFHRKRVIIEDTRKDERWRPYRSWVQDFSLLSCWTEPIVDLRGELLGTFAVYHREPHYPSSHEIATVVCAAHLASRALEQVSLAEIPSLAPPSPALWDQMCHLLPGNVLVFDVKKRALVQILGDTKALLGYSSEELMRWGADIAARLIHPEDLPRFEEHLKEVGRLEGRNSRSFVYRIRRADGTWRWFANRDTVFVRDDQGEVCQLLGSVVDITEYRKSEDDFRATQSRLTYVLENTPACVFIKTLDMRYIFVNEQAAQAMGLPRTYLEGKSDPELAPKEIYEQWQASDREVLETGKAFRFNTSFSGQDGKRRDYVMVKFPLKEAGEIVAICGMATEVTEVKELYAQNENLLRLIERSSDFVAMASPDGRGVYLNPAGRALVGIENDQDISKFAIPDVIYPDDWPLMKAKLEELVATGNAQGEIRFRNIRTGEPIPIWWSGTAVNDPETGKISGLGTVSRDLTPLRKIQSELKLQAEELARSNRDLEQFAAVASHDLKEPLHMISTYLQMLERNHVSKLNFAAREYITMAIDNARRMSSLIDALLRYSRVGATNLRLVEVDCQQLRDEIQETLKLSIVQSRAEVHWKNLPVIFADRSLLAQVFQNLVSNAIKFREPERSPVITVACRKEKTEWLFSVTDNGIGMTADQASRAFELFVRIPQRSELPGEGIGLATAKRIVERHKGRIWAESVPGEGTTVHFTIPA